ncbi:serine/threonine protein kinase [Lysobacter sp. GX 14042]|uniref:serine/threonine-protein kinase n=1 Tax=Lysobacter sp. GX 14042 TaxID=2907155 RepID=UPI001F168554|nr:serine/threonine-protein kinase [Lysobacter sp. GX 14042]MCE7032201.1 serine/threonine protein kinase [Lysobacter sp. GX 14042]
MDPERWQRISAELDLLLELPPGARTQRLDDLAGVDAGLAAELRRMLELEDVSADFLSEPVLAPAGMVLPGSAVGPYRLEHLLGEGGMGQVWLAARADGLYQRRVALKLLRPGLADKDLQARFTREREILARLEHPHIARLLDAGISANGLPYLALERVDGIPVTDWCRRHRPSVADRLEMFLQVCAAVSHAHANLIVHLDLKPSNILVTPAGEVRLLDFGIAKLLDLEAALERTRTGTRAFTLHYAAPEQVRGEPVSTMTDVYSLGVILYELLVGARPYRPVRDSDAAMEEAILLQEPMRPSSATASRRGRDLFGDDEAARRRHARRLSGDLDNIVCKALGKSPDQRYPSVEALAQDLRRHATGRPVHARPPNLRYRLGKFLLRHRWPLATGTLTSLVVLAAFGLVAWQARQSAAEVGRAQAMQAFMVGVFEHADQGPAGQPVSLRELLTRTVERADRELAGQPLSRAEVLAMVARVRLGLGDLDEASVLLARQERLLRAADDVPPALRLQSRLQQGRLLSLRGEPSRCIELMHRGHADAVRKQAHLPILAAAYHAQLGRCHRQAGELQQARMMFERALVLRRAHPGPTAADEVGILVELAGLHADAGRSGMAGIELRAARQRLLADGAPDHPMLADIDRQLAMLQRASAKVRAPEPVATAD